MILSDLKTVKPSLGTVYLSGRGLMACTAASQQGAMKMCRLYFRELTTFTYSQTDVINQQNYLFRFLMLARAVMLLVHIYNRTFSNNKHLYHRAAIY